MTLESILEAVLILRSTYVGLLKLIRRRLLVIVSTAVKILEERERERLIFSLGAFSFLFWKTLLYVSIILLLDVEKSCLLTYKDQIERCCITESRSALNFMDVITEVPAFDVFLIG